MSNENLQDVEKLDYRPFTRFCMSIGAVPSSYLAGLSIEEQLLWLCSYLEKEVIPTVNNNGEAVEELQGLYVELKNYVDNYFDNLDVQEEINNKLDVMAEDGTLDQIINQEIFGELNQDIETINNTTIPDLQSTLEGEIGTVQTDVDTLKRTALYLGNSYVGGVGSTSGNDGLFALTKNLFSAAYKKTGSGTGWLTYTDHSDDTFLTLLNAAVSDSNIPKDDITDVIIVGAWGETRALNELSDNISTFANNVQTAITSFNTTLSANFPNVKRISYIYAESRSQKSISSVYPNYFYEPFWVHNRFINLLPKNGIEYLGWIGFNILLDSNYFSSDKIHPNDSGYKHLAALFKSAYDGTFSYHPITKVTSSTPCTITSGSSIQGLFTLYPDKCSINIRQLTLASGSTPAHSTTCSLIDFTNTTNFSLPLPTGATSSYLGTGFTCTTKRPQDSNFTNNDNIYGRLNLIKSSDDNDSTNIQMTIFGNSKTVASNITSMTTPFELNWTLNYSQSL